MSNITDPWVFDMEVYPNFVSFTAVHGYSGWGTEDGDVVIFELSDRRNEVPQLREWVRGKVLVGYNSLGYDRNILNYLLKYDCTPKQVWDLSDLIINDNDDKDLRTFLREELRSAETYKNIDLARITTGNGGRFPSLKQIAIHLHWPRLESLPYPPHLPLTLAEMDNVLAYNLNDVEITKKLFHELRDALAMRGDTGKFFNVDLVNASESMIGNIVFEVMLGYKPSTGTRRRTVYGGDVISPRVKFKTPEFNALMGRISESELLNGGYAELIQLGGQSGFTFQVINKPARGYKPPADSELTLSLGVGGLHSVDKSKVYRAEAGKVIIRDADVTSYYPNIVLSHGYEPAHLIGKFSPIYSLLVSERVKAKAAGDSLKAWVLKIAVNGIFGKFNSTYSWLYDPKVFYGVTINGQLFLLMLIESLLLAGIEILSVNTDGVLCRFSPEQEAKYNKICADWVAGTGFELEYGDYATYICRDVNNYTAKTTSGKLKGRGAFSSFTHSTDYGRGYDKPIVAKAVINYFMDGTPIEKTIEGEQNIHLFFSTQNIGKQFTPVYKSVDGFEITMQRNNRYYVVPTGGGTLYKVQGSRKISVTTQQVLIANDVTEDMPSPDYAYYIAEAQKLINMIEPPVAQLSLFG